MPRADTRPNSELVVNDIRHNVGFFEPDHYARLGEADAAHVVLFGNMPDYEGEVAVKAFNKTGKAENEMSNLQVVAERGLEALEPLAVAEGGLATYLITRRYRGLRHLGQVAWHQDVASKELSSVIIPTMETAAQTLGLWHNKGVYHGDAQVKNVSYNRDGTPVFTDAEKTQFNSGKGTSVDFSERDVKKLGITMLSRGLLEERRKDYRTGFVAAYFLDPYFDTVLPDSSAMDKQERAKVIEDYWKSALYEDWKPEWVVGELVAPFDKS